MIEIMENDKYRFMADFLTREPCYPRQLQVSFSKSLNSNKRPFIIQTLHRFQPYNRPNILCQINRQPQLKVSSSSKNERTISPFISTLLHSGRPFKDCFSFADSWGNVKISSRETYPKRTWTIRIFTWLIGHGNFIRTVSTMVYKRRGAKLEYIKWVRGGIRDGNQWGSHRQCMPDGDR